MAVGSSVAVAVAAAAAVAVTVDMDFIGFDYLLKSRDSVVCPMQYFRLSFHLPSFSMF